MIKNYFLFMVSALFILMQGCGNIPGSSSPVTLLEAYQAVVKDENGSKYFGEDDSVIIGAKKAFLVKNNSLINIDYAKYKKIKERYLHDDNLAYILSKDSDKLLNMDKIKLNYIREVQEKIVKKLYEKTGLKKFFIMQLLDKSLKLSKYHFLAFDILDAQRGEKVKLYHVKYNEDKVIIDEIPRPDDLNLWWSGQDIYINSQWYYVLVHFDNSISSVNPKDNDYQYIPIFENEQVKFYKSNDFIKKFFGSDYDLYSFIKNIKRENPPKISIYHDGLYMIYSSRKIRRKLYKAKYKFIPFNPQKSAVEIVIE